MKTVSIFIVLEMHMKNRLSVDYFYSKIIVEEIKLSALVQFHSVISLAVVVRNETAAHLVGIMGTSALELAQCGVLFTS